MLHKHLSNFLPQPQLLIHHTITHVDVLIAQFKRASRSNRTFRLPASPLVVRVVVI